MKLLDKFNIVKNTPSDINEHLETLKKYTEKCEFVIELGTGQTVSTWAFLAGLPKKFHTIDIKHPSERGIDFSIIEKTALDNNIEFQFFLESSLEINLPPHDLLFIDTKHNYETLKAELNKHNHLTKKYIIFHDTVSFGDRDEFGDGPGLNLAIDEFLAVHTEWKVLEIFSHNNGLTVLHRVC